MLITILSFILALAILVTFHEYGHFYAARRCGVKVLRFSVGFGQPLVTIKDRLGTAFTLAPVPLGGYVKMLDEREGEVPVEDLHQAFTQKTVWQRMFIVAAGPIANFILAIVLYFILALIGLKGVSPVVSSVDRNSLADQAGLQATEEIIAIDGQKTQTWTQVYEALGRRIGDTGDIELTVATFTGEQENSGFTQTRLVSIEKWLADADRPDMLAELGIKVTEPETDWVFTTIVPQGAAEKAGIQPGDQLISYDGIAVDQWRGWVEYVQARPNQAIQLELQRDSQLLAIELIPGTKEVNGNVIGSAGLGSNSVWAPGMVRFIDYSLLEAMQYGVSKTWEQSVLILSFLKKLITLEVSTKNLGGAFTIAEAAGGSANAGMTYYLSFLAFFSVSLGVFNLLPIPVLDGGHLLFYAIEALKGKPVNERLQLLGYQVGLVFIVSIMVIAHYNDLVRIFS